MTEFAVIDVANVYRESQESIQNQSSYKACGVGRQASWGQWHKEAKDEKCTFASLLYNQLNEMTRELESSSN